MRSEPPPTEPTVPRGARPTEPQSLEPEILEPQPRHQRWTLMALALFASLAISSLVHLVQEVDAARVISVESVRRAAEQIQLVAARYFRGAAAVIGLFGVYLGLKGVLILRSGRYPRPGAWVVRPTPVRRGARARVRGAVTALVGALLLAVAFYFPPWADLQLAQALAGALQTPDVPPEALLPTVE